MRIHHPYTSSHLLLVLLLIGMLLAACGPAPSSTPALTHTATERLTTTPWQTGTPGPLFAPLTGNCPGKAPAPPRPASMHYGINAFLFGTDKDRVLALTSIAGFNWIRQQIHWRDLEGERGQFVWKPLDQIVSAARTRDMQLLLSVVRSPSWATSNGPDGLPDDPATLAHFLQQVATRYRGRVTAYQIWNEPNLAHENGGKPATPAAYLATLQAAYQAIKAADPCALVVSASLAATSNPDPAVATDDLPFFETLYTLNNGAFLQSADIVGVHTGAGPYSPTSTWSPDTPEQSPHYFRHIERTHEMMLRHNDPRQVWLTEYGWTVTTAQGAAPPVTEQQQSTYLVDALWFVRQRYPWVGAIFVWNLNFSVIAPPDDEKTTYSILNPDWSIRPAFVALQNNVNALQDVDRPPFVPENATHHYTWSFPGRGSMQSTPILSPDGTIYIVSDPGTLYAINPTGLLQWNFDASGVVNAPPTRAPDGTLYLGDSGSLLTALNPDGTVQWVARLISPARGSPIHISNRVVVATTVGQISAFDTQGREIWTHDLEAESTPLALTSDGALLVMDATGTATRLNRDGQVDWRIPLGNEFWSAPVPDSSGSVYVVTVGGRILSLDARGLVRWTSDLNVPVVAPPLVGNDGRVYVASCDGVLSALAAADGSLLWRFANERGTTSCVPTPPAQDIDGTLYLGTDDERLLAIDTDGMLRWQVQLRGMTRARPAIAPDGTLYIPTTSGRLYAFAR